MATDIYPSTYEVTQNDIDELRQRAQKALAFSKSPHAKVEVPVDANTLLRLLEALSPRL